jgi:hypothetical protein
MKDQVDELIKRLRNHKDIIITHKYESKKDIFNYYHHFTGKYKGSYFMIYLYKVKGYEPNFETSPNVSDNLEEFQEFLKTLTNLKFTLSRK